MRIHPDLTAFRRALRRVYNLPRLPSESEARDYILSLRAKGQAYIADFRQESLAASAALSGFDIDTEPNESARAEIRARQAAGAWN